MAVAKPALHAAICNVSILTVVHAKKVVLGKKIRASRIEQG